MRGTPACTADIVFTGWIRAALRVGPWTKQSVKPEFEPLEANLGRFWTTPTDSGLAARGGRIFVRCSLCLRGFGRGCRGIKKRTNRPNTKQNGTIRYGPVRFSTEPAQNPHGTHTVEAGGERAGLCGMRADSEPARNPCIWGTVWNRTGNHRAKCRQLCAAPPGTMQFCTEPAWAAT